MLPAQVVRRFWAARDQRRNMNRPLRARLSFSQMYGGPRTPGPSFIGHRSHPTLDHDIRAIAFYLPQFYAIPENDAAWGKGFTEWTSTTRATPQFLGHRQPRLPGELGFYDLRLKEVMLRQIKLARNYGISGFAFHWYWFHGRRILHEPVEAFLRDRTLDFPFLLSWANQSWTRRWDGRDDEVIVKQEFSPGDDETHMRALIPFFRDPRYVRIDGRPVFIVYDTMNLPDPAATAERWRRICRDEGIGEIFLLGTTCYSGQDPRTIAFDGRVQFPPHGRVPKYESGVRLLNPAWQGGLFDFAKYVEQQASAPSPPFREFPCAIPDWDNTPRLRERANVFVGASPEGFERFLAACIERARRDLPEGSRIVFINAWNEWAESAYVEPDVENGYANLQACRNALDKTRPAGRGAVNESKATFHEAKPPQSNQLHDLTGGPHGH